MPAACKNAVTKIITMQTGAIHLVKTIYNPFKRNCEVICTSSIILWGFKKNPTKIQVHKATTGIRILLVKKSKESKIDFPNIWTPSQIPNPKDEQTPKAMEKSSIPIQTGMRFQPNLSWIAATIASIRPIEEVIAARNTRTKNTAPTTCPVSYTHLDVYKRQE